ncbi:MAG: hypothetical protein QW607_01850, partial [Desulfurococcaceae archaeon]
KIITKSMYLDKYVFTRGEVGVRGVRGDQIYTFLYEFFREKGALEIEGGGIVLHRDFVKRFSLLVLLDEKVIMDFGNEIKKPKNLVIVNPSKEDENWWMPISQEEKRKILWWVLYISLSFGLTGKEVSLLLRRNGLSFTGEVFTEIRGEVEKIVQIDRNNVRRRGKKKKRDLKLEMI